MTWIVRKVAGAAAGYLLIAGSAAQAQTPPAPDASAGPPPLTCTKPADFAPLEKSGPAMTRFQKQLDDYKNCIGDYSRINGAKANALAAESRRYSDAANGSIDDFNAYVKGLNLDAK